MLRRDREVETTKPLRYTFTVSTVVEIIDAVKRLDEKQKNEFLDKLAEIDFDDAWDRLLDNPQPRPRLDAFLRESAAEPDEPLDPKRL